MKKYEPKDQRSAPNNLSAEEALRQSEEKYRTLFETIEEGFAIMELIRDEEGQVTDLIYLEVNKAFGRHTGLHDIIGKTSRQTLPNYDPDRFRFYQQIVDSGETTLTEFYVNDIGRWLRAYFSRMGGQHSNLLVAVFEDITERKLNEERERENGVQYRARLEQEVRDRMVELQESRALFQATLDSNMEMIQVFKAVRDEQGKIIDFIWILNNASSAQIYGDVIGKSLLQNNPGVAEAGIFDHFVSVVESGIPMQYEKHYVREQFDGWFSQSVVKLNDGVATNTVDITKSKRAELQLKESRDRLRSILDTTIVQMSIMEAVRNADGQIMDLLIKETNKELEKETGRTDLVGKFYAEEYPGIKRTGLFDMIIKTIETGEPQQTEYFYGHEGFDKWYTCMFVKMGDGVVATNMDITPRKQAEEQVRKMEADQQREIFKVSLTTLEEERQRIAESLHNGIGQILYGTKISLGGLKQELTEEEFDGTKRYTNELLTEAIKETRRVSHELTPTILNEFGLKAAIGHICEQLQNDVRFKHKITGVNSRLEKYMELAIYRTVQELLLNVVKHAQATASVVEVAIQKDVVRINVSDNGRGMEASKGHKPGIGLASIKSKIELLKGTVKIQSSATEGTMVKVMIPLPER